MTGNIGEVKESNPKDGVGSRKSHAMSVVPSGVVHELGLAMLEGALRYGRHNYRVIGVRTSVYVDAAKRHMDAFWEGEDLDPDSGICHITKAIACLAVLRDAQMVDKVVDDRPPPLPEGWVDRMNEMAAAIVDRYPDAKEPYVAEPPKK